jgi:cell division protein FtsI (penicillin-binding protein 3)
MAFTFICLFGIAIIGKAVMIQVKEGPKLRAEDRELQTRFDTLIAERGNIYTEDGTMLSTSIPEFDVHIDFSIIDSALFNKNIDTLSQCLAGLFLDKSSLEYKEEMVRAYNDEEKYYLLRKKMKYNQFELLRTFPIFSKGKAHGGLIAESIEKRTMPYNMVGLRAIGMFRDSNKTGIERAYDKYLTGENGRRMLRKSTGNNWIPIEGTEIDPQNGKDVVTTIDINIQDVAEHALMSVLEKYECTYGTCIVMEVGTGKIRSLVNLGRQTDGTYWEDFNYAMSPTEPGSTFKLVTLLSILNDKKTNVDQIIDPEGGKIRFGNRVMKDSHLGLGPIPIWKAYAESSNAAFAKLAYTYYRENPRQFTDHLKQYHLDTKTGIDLPGERSPVINTPDSKLWSATSLPWMATGYGIQVTPLHTCMLYNAVANHGHMMRPYLVSSIREYGKDIKTFEPLSLGTIADSGVLSQVGKCVRAVVTEGTAKGIQSPYYTMAGKTGTAQVSDGAIKYSSGVYQGSFVGFIPAIEPRYTICVVIRTKPHSAAYYGGAIAAPVFRMVADKIFSANMGAWDGPLDSLALTGGHILPARTTTAHGYQVLLGAIRKRTVSPSDAMNVMMQLQTDSTRQLAVKPAGVFRNIVPDVTGMGLRDAVYLLENSGMQVTVKGRGKVVTQSIEPGIRVTKGQNIILQLS